MKKIMLTIATLAAAMLLCATQTNQTGSLKSIPPVWCPPICR